MAMLDSESWINLCFKYKSQTESVQTYIDILEPGLSRRRNSVEVALQHLHIVSIVETVIQQFSKKFFSFCHIHTHPQSSL